MPTISTCGGCGNVFSSTALFDVHRVGGFSKPRYTEKDTKRKYPTGYIPHTRRCMNLAELQAAGYRPELRLITVFHEGQPRRVERDVWFDPAAREAMREAFSKEPEEATAPPVPALVR